LSDSTARDVTW
nr:Chain C, LEU-SER-ASP-SER-THR-ARG-ASP-VAL-THR-TRP [synthetic construct]